MRKFIDKKRAKGRLVHERPAQVLGGMNLVVRIIGRVEGMVCLAHEYTPYGKSANQNNSKQAQADNPDRPGNHRNRNGIPAARRTAPRIVITTAGTDRTESLRYDPSWWRR
jgi:hypothetical protein